ncbi:MAG: DUF3164 family protein [Kangiella sp.]|nr:DUF3164 family protein [Kangiella sp.]MCW9029231.1 DUF3164 family protein [Kangiella sp.]
MVKQNDLVGYLQNAQGHLVPTEQVDEYDQMRDQLVKEIVGQAQIVQKVLKDFKTKSMDDIQGFVELSAERYEVSLGGKKGNVTLTSYDGKYRIVRSIGEYLQFDERLSVAKELVDQYINDKIQGVDGDLAKLVRGAFKVDKDGRISTQRVLGLRSIGIKDDKWMKAMNIISDSVHVANTKAYVRVYERVGNSDEYKQIPLNVAGA